jgi:hypothetical protein
MNTTPTIATIAAAAATHINNTTTKWCGAESTMSDQSSSVKMSAHNSELNGRNIEKFFTDGNLRCNYYVNAQE